MEIKFMSISMAPDDYNTIEKYCKNNSLNRSDFMRKIALEKINREIKKNKNDNNRKKK